MLTDFFLPWAMLAVSLFNTVILLWLGLTVLFNATQRHIGVWVAGSGLLAGGAFFAAHTAMLDYSLRALLFGIRSWWYAGWCAIIVLPFAWYVLMLWYSGFWDDETSDLHRRQRPCLWLMFGSAIALSFVVAIANPFRVLAQMANVPSDFSFSLRGWPWLLVGYPLYLLLCIGLALDVLRRPNPSGRALRDLARQRARPWLIASSLVQLLVSLMVAIAIVGLVYFSLWGNLPATVENHAALWATLLEFIVCVLIGIAVVLMGKAIVSYEILTGKTLPRRGFLRQWRYLVLLAAVYSALISLSQNWELRAIYPLLLSTMLMSLLLGLFSWRSYAEQEQHTSNLRSIVSNQHLYEHLLSPSTSNGRDAPDSFRALCREVLGAGVAYLQPLGPLSPLVSSEMSFPSGLPMPSAKEVALLFTSPQIVCLPLESNRYGGAVWAVPLWGERGLIGVLMLGEKEDGGLYTQEEIEIARAGGERLIDARAGIALSQRLMSLQRQRLAESQLLDRRARRALHDEILPRVHTAILSLSAQNDAASVEALNQLTDVHRQISDLLREMPMSTTPEIARLGLLGSLRRLLETEWKDAFDEVIWKVEDGVEKRLQMLHPLTGEVLFYACREALRNTERYGRGEDAQRVLQLKIGAWWDDALHIVIEDNGVGLSAIEYSNGAQNDGKGGSGKGGSDKGGSGRGLALHSTMMAIIGGTLSVESEVGQGTRVSLWLPQDVALVAANNE